MISRKVMAIKRSASIKLIVYTPTTVDGRAELDRRAAMVHADLVRARIDHLNCPAVQKTELLDSVIDTVRGKQEQVHRKGDIRGQK